MEATEFSSLNNELSKIEKCILKINKKPISF